MPKKHDDFCVKCGADTLTIQREYLTGKYAARLRQLTLIKWHF